MRPLPLDVLINRTPENIAIELLEAKRAEAAANAARVALEEELTAAIDNRKVDDEGAVTYKLDGFKVVVKRELNRKASVADIKAVKGVPANLLPIKVKEEVDATGLKYLQNNEPKIYAKLAAVVTVEPKKVAVTVTRAD